MCEVLSSVSVNQTFHTSSFVVFNPVNCTGGVTKFATLIKQVRLVGGGELIVGIEQSFNEMHQMAPAKATSLCSSSFVFNLPQEQCNQHACL
jgi:hypothetical protein